MKLSISNIGWTDGEDDEVLKFLAETNVGGVEVAPTRLSKEIFNKSETEIIKYRRFFDSYGFAGSIFTVATLREARTAVI